MNIIKNLLCQKIPGNIYINLIHIEQWMGWCISVIDIDLNIQKIIYVYKIPPLWPRGL